MRKVITILFCLIAPVCFAQYSWNSFPASYSLIARNVTTNKGLVVFDFKADANINPDSIVLRKYTNGQLAAVIHPQVTLDQNNQHVFQQIDTILAGFYQYTYELWYGSTIMVRRAERMCCGDFYIINGQSNAVAQMVSGFCASDCNDFIRTFGYSSEAGCPQEWSVAKGDSLSDTKGHIGQLAIALASKIVNEHSIPVCILNGAMGAKSISYFKRDSIDKENQNSNYGRLYVRAKNADALDKVRAIIWYQGENDAYFGTPREEYASALRNLIKCWKEDFSQLEDIYIFQVKNGCGQGLNKTWGIQQAQADMLNYDPLVNLIGTSTLRQTDEHCHYAYHNGYQLLGEKVYRQISHFQYGAPDNSNIYSARIVRVSRKGDHDLVVCLQHPEQLFIYPGMVLDFFLSESQQHPTSIVRKQNNLMLHFEQFVAPNESLSYTDIQSTVVTDDTLMQYNGLLCAYHIPVLQESGSNQDSPGTYLIPYDSRQGLGDQSGIAPEIQPTSAGVTYPQPTPAMSDLPPHLCVYQNNDDLYIYSRSDMVLMATYKMFNENGSYWRSGKLDILKGMNIQKLFMEPGSVYLINLVIQEPSGAVVRKMKLKL